MKKKIYVSIFITALIATILSSLITVYSFYGFFINQAKDELRVSCSIMRDSINMIADNESYVDAVKEAAKYMRLTLIKPDGTVAFDSLGNPIQMDNHLDREEVSQAVETGFGEAVRKSETMGKDTAYCAFKLSDDYILRGARDLDNIASVFVNIIPIILGIAIVLIVISIMISNILTKKLVKPIEETATKLEEKDVLLYGDNTYDELIPFFNKLSSQQQKIREHIISLQKERDTIKTITDNMQEGLVILNNRQEILSANKSAILMLDGSTAFSYTGKPIISLVSEAAITDNLYKVITNGDRLDTVITRGTDGDAKECRVFVNPVYAGEKITGVILMIIDVTELRKAEKIRREFSANVSHELKTPLTSISGFAEMIESGIVASKEDTVKFAANIHKEATRLITLIDDIIRLTEIEENNQAEFELIKLLPICRETVESLGFIAKQKNIVININGDATINANPHMIGELVYNLTENAIKYNKENGIVDIVIEESDEKVKLSVKDTGIGIPPEHLERIFERFYRIDKSRSKQNGGTGLGLSIVKHIVGYHNAKLSIDSEPQIGTTVSIEF